MFEQTMLIILDILPISLLLAYSRDNNHGILIVSFLVSFLTVLVALHLSKKVLIKDKYAIMRDLLTGNIEILLGLIGFLVELVLINQISSIVYTMISSSWSWSDVLKLLIIFFEVLSVGSTVLIFYDAHIKVQEEKMKKIEREPRKALVLAISKPSNEKDNEGYPRNFVPYKELLDFHASKLEYVFLLCSKEVKDAGGLDLFKQLIENIKPCIKIYCEEADYNNGDSLKSSLIRIDSTIRENDIKDKDISVYVSSGTSATTVYLTLFGLENLRQLEYMCQGEKREILKLDLMKEDALKFINKIY